jgi:hypothetical protein
MLSTVAISILILVLIGALSSWNIIEIGKMMPRARRYRADHRTDVGVMAPCRVPRRIQRR